MEEEIIVYLNWLEARLNQNNQKPSQVVLLPAYKCTFVISTFLKCPLFKGSLTHLSNWKELAVWFNRKIG